MGRPMTASFADLDAAIKEANQRGMSMFELEASIAYSTLWSEQPSMYWHDAGLPLSRGAVLAALESIRRDNAARKVSECETTSVG
jgi:hypothetical protein